MTEFLSRFATDAGCAKYLFERHLPEGVCFFPLAATSAPGLSRSVCRLRPPASCTPASCRYHLLLGGVSGAHAFQRHLGPCNCRACSAWVPTNPPGCSVPSCAGPLLIQIASRSTALLRRTRQPFPRRAPTTTREAAVRRTRRCSPGRSKSTAVCRGALTRRSSRALPRRKSTPLSSARWHRQPSSQPTTDRPTRTSRNHPQRDHRRSYGQPASCCSISAACSQTSSAAGWRSTRTAQNEPSALPRRFRLPLQPTPNAARRLQYSRHPNSPLLLIRNAA